MHEYEKAGYSGAFNAGREIGKLLTDIGTLAAGGAGIGKGIIKVTDKVVGRLGKGAAGVTHIPKPSSSLSYIDEPPFNPHGSIGAAQPWSIKGRIKYVELPTEGKIRYVPPDTYSPTQQLPRGPNNGYLDKFGNEWTKGSSRTAGQAFEWDVQLSKTGRAQLGWASRDKSHLNISLDGKITHK